MERVSEVIKEDYTNWRKGDLILITAGTGRGKTYFIKNILNEYSKIHNKNILYLTNRDNLKKQIQSDIGADSNITVINYQKIESLILKNISFDNFDYIVMDEGHYFFTDSSFNIKTDLFFKEMLGNKSICKIIMTATPRILLKYFNMYDIRIDHKYDLPTDYHYIKSITAFSTYESIDSIIEDIPQNEQVLLFTSAKRAYEISQKFNGAFICSQYNSNGYNKYIDRDELNNIIEKGEFNNHLLCCTTVLDNGVNIKENTPVKHIILDILDVDEFIQCLGRKRIAEDESINLYFYNQSDKRKLNGFRNKVITTLERADFLTEHGQNEYVKYNFKRGTLSDERIIDDIIESGQIQKIINECMYTKLQEELYLYNRLLSNKYNIKFQNIILYELGLEDCQVIEYEVTEKSLSVEEMLENEVGKVMLQAKDREKLIEFINLRDPRNNRLLKRRATLNNYLEEIGVNYYIQEFKTSRMVDGKKKNFKQAWRIMRLTNK